MKTALTIAGSDSSGGAGIQADLKTFAAHRVYGMSVITAVTAQNTTGVRSIANIPEGIIKDQIEAVYEDIAVDAVKIGMLSTSTIITAVADALTSVKATNIIVDPVMVSKSGHHLLQREAADSLKEQIIPIAKVITPNLPEAEVLLQQKIQSVEEMKDACLELKKLGPEMVLLKGGHLSGDPIDILFDGNEFHIFSEQRIDTKNTHGTGCTLSSAIAANLAKGWPIVEAVKNAKEYITGAIKHSLNIGHGNGPTNHFYALYEQNCVALKEE
ncbi:bifunctional hydroxymethylpyrimidine kinase/phosphomethylpyrimidine kinase [Bacillus sp. V33-4]|uniref:bifunctional hydroxymethylpyrimidine kinase/phosphomethylpyrimidine kinase n=1 Tax=Bacillus sp. V33-4 TaxID=2054169 RepID=UPI000C7903B8|nr:bifunctional hydroxymethylpyrimidine kinase/phosphomethylpyrimidine kinase [Bacillus sp. V33-4]PLR86666.1 bifunctional hydroxymethylpyrimidine kinase/phosphomethylpyrimidine kinase [Bacillus sp. V33-4]